MGFHLAEVIRTHSHRRHQCADPASPTLPTRADSISSYEAQIAALKQERQQQQQDCEEKEREVGRLKHLLSRTHPLDSLEKQMEKVGVFTGAGGGLQPTATTCWQVLDRFLWARCPVGRCFTGCLVCGLAVPISIAPQRPAGSAGLIWGGLEHSKGEHGHALEEGNSARQG